MAKLIMLAGTTSRREYIFIQNSSSTTGTGLTGLTNASAGWKVYYVRPGAAPVSITLGAAVTATTAFTSASFSEVDATNMPGIYRFDVPDAVFAAGSDKAIVMLSGPTNVAPVTLEYQLTAAGESWIASGVWNAQVASYATAGSGETLGTDTYGTKVCRTSTANRNMAVAGTQRVEANVATITNAAITSAAFATDAITSTVIAADAITSAELSSTANDEVAAAVWAAATRTITGGTIGTVGSGAITTGSFAAGAINATAIADSAITIRLSSDATASKGRIVDGTIASDTWNALLASYTTANSFGARIVRTRSTSPSNEVTITGSFHIAADVHELQPAVILAADFAAGAIDANALSTDAVNEIADAILNRNIAGGSSTGRLVKDAFRAIRNKSVIAAGTLTIYQEDDTTSAWTATVGSDPAANPIISIDPA